MKPRKSRYLVLDLIRILSVGMVIVFHIGLKVGWPGMTWGRYGNIFSATLGNLGVIILIILSGLILQLIYGKKGLSRKDFYLRRLSKIYSIYWPSLIISILIYAFLKKPTVSTDIVCNVLGTCAFLGQWGGPYLETGWFIGLIVALYLLFPFLSSAIRKNPHLTIIALFIISLAYRQHVAQNHQFYYFPPENHWHPLSRIFEFGLGIYLAEVVPRTFWTIVKIQDSLSKKISYFAELSFPAYLLHYPVLGLFRIEGNMLSQMVTIVAFLGLTGLLSSRVLLFQAKEDISPKNCLISN